MKVRFPALFSVIALITLSVEVHGQALPTANGKSEAALSQAATDNKSAYVLFYRDWDAATEAMSSVVKATVAKHAAKSTWVAVRVTDTAEKPVVEKFQVGRAPSPLVLAVHPNGAVTGVFMKQVTEANLAQCLVSPRKAECMKLLQKQQLVLLCVQTSAQQSIPQGVLDFQADPHFANRTGLVTIRLDDSNETGFVEELKLDARSSAQVIVFMAPPGVLVGKFPATATKDQLAAALAAAGKCCDDPNCKHGQK